MDRDLKQLLKQLSLEPEAFVEQLPAATRAAVEELRGLQNEVDDLQEKHDKDLAELEAKYEQLYAPLHKKRADVVSGAKPAARLPEGAGAPEAGGGVPDFWLVVLLRCDATRDTMNEKDVDVLRYLTDVRCETLQPELLVPDAGKGVGGEEEEEEEEATGGFRITMTFAKNPYFTNKDLVKTYYMADSRDPVLEHSEGTKINWKPGKDTTFKVVVKKPKPPATKIQTSLEKVDSFFDFFNPPHVPDEDAKLDPEEVEMLEVAIENDYDIGDTIRRSLIPNAVMWYTGEALDDDDYDGANDGASNGANDGASNGPSDGPSGGARGGTRGGARGGEGQGLRRPDNGPAQPTPSGNSGRRRMRDVFVEEVVASGAEEVTKGFAGWFVKLMQNEEESGKPRQ